MPVVIPDASVLDCVQALGMQCMSNEPEARPKFDQILNLLDGLEVPDQ